MISLIRQIRKNLSPTLSRKISDQELKETIVEDFHDFFNQRTEEFHFEFDLDLDEIKIHSYPSYLQALEILQYFKSIYPAKVQNILWRIEYDIELEEYCVYARRI